MRKHLIQLGVLLTLAQVPAVAFGQAPNWKIAAESDSAVYFVDTTRLRKTGDRLTVWTLMDLRTGSKKDPQSGKSYLSTVNFNSVDCASTAADLRSVHRYAENMGKGDVVNSASFPPATPEVFPPNSVGEGWLLFACARFAQLSRPPAAAPKPKHNPVPQNTSPF